MPAGHAARRFLFATSIDAVGTGLIMPLTALFFTRDVRLPTVAVGAGLSAAGFVGLAVSPLIGPVLGRFEARRVLIGCYVLSAGAYAAYPLARTVAAFVIVVTVAAVSNRLTQPARLGLARDLGDEPQDRLRLLAAIATVRNVGFGIGGLLTAVLLTTNSHWGYVAVALGNAASYVLVAVSLISLDAAGAPTEANAATGYRALWREHRFYFGLAALNAVLLLYDSILVIGLPLWITRATHASPSIAALLFTTNTVIVIGAQTRVSQAATSRQATARAYRRSGLCAAVACLLCAISGALALGPAILALFAAAVMLTGGELNASAAEWGASLTLAPGWIKGELLGLFGVGTAAQLALGPGVVTLAVLASGAGGWLALALVLAAAGLGASALASHIPGHARHEPERPEDAPARRRIIAAE